MLDFYLYEWEKYTLIERNVKFIPLSGPGGGLPTLL